MLPVYRLGCTGMNVRVEVLTNEIDANNYNYCNANGCIRFGRVHTVSPEKFEYDAQPALLPRLTNVFFFVKDTITKFRFNIHQLITLITANIYRDCSKLCYKHETNYFRPRSCRNNNC